MPRQLRAAPPPSRSASRIRHRTRHMFSGSERDSCRFRDCIDRVIVSLVGSRDLKVVIDSYLRRPVVHRVSKNVPPLACYNFDTHEWILILFGRNVTDKVGNQKTLYYTTLNNLCFCTTWQNRETRKAHFSLNWTVLHAQCTCALSSWKKKIVICDVFELW